VSATAWAAADDSREPGRSHGLITPPPAERCIDVWPEPVYAPADRAVPSWWLVGGHGGAGVSMLTASWSIAGDAMGAFPAGFEQESPFVVVVARESAWGITRAHDLLTQHLSGYGGATTLVGLVTVAASPSRLKSELRQRLEVVAGLVDDHHWRIPWIDTWNELTPDELPFWTPGDPIPTGRKREPPDRAVPREVADVADAIRTTIISILQTNP
jgi:hypothetical protein